MNESPTTDTRPDSRPLAQVQWVVALIAPWAIAPHPNFSVKDISAIQAMGLLSDYRYSHESSRYKSSWHGWEAELVRACADSLLSHTQAAATDALWRLASRRDLPAGARSAAAIYGSVGLSELERSDEAAQRLQALAEELRPQCASNSGRLVIAALLQQRVLRLFDSSRFSLATAAIDDVLSIVPMHAAWDESFEVTQGISWGSGLVQDDVAEAIQIDARQARATMDAFSSDSWMEVVRARPGWVSHRLGVRAAERDAMVLRDAFESEFESTSGTRYFGRASAQEKGYAALLLSELAGATGLAKRNREQLGRVVLLEGVEDAKTAVEALRLLRQSGQTRPLQSALNWLRDAGPTEAISADARRVADRALRGRWATEQDLLVLESAADFLDDSERERAIDAALIAMETESVSGRSNWSLHEKVWRAVLRLLPGTGAHTLVARRSAEYFDKPGMLVEPFVDTLARLVRALDWSQVDSTTRGIWTGWASSGKPQDAGPDLDSLLRAVGETLGGQTEVMPRNAGLDQSAFLADNGLPKSMGERVLDENEALLVQALQSEANEAAHGVLTVGRYSVSLVAAAFAARFGRSHVWNALVEHLTNPSIDASLKASALDRLASDPSVIPPQFLTEIRARYPQILGSPRNSSLFSEPSLHVFPEAIRLGSAIGAVDSVTTVNAIMQLAAGTAPARVEAAKTVPYFALNDSAWGHGVLLQLSYDRNPFVQAQAAASLVRSLGAESVLSNAVRGRCREILHSDGIRGSLAVIQALRAEARGGRVMHEFLADLRSVSTREAPRVVADAARSAITDMDVQSR